MINYYFISKRLFDEDLLKKQEHSQFIFELFNFIRKGNFVLVVKRDFQKHFLKNKNIINDNRLRVKIEKLFENQLNKKIRFVKEELEDDENIILSLKKFPSFDKFIDLDNKKIKDSKSIFFDSLQFSFYREETFDFLEKGMWFSEMKEIEFEKMFLGSSEINFTVYSFIDRIWEPHKNNFENFLTNDVNQINRSILSFSLDYLCKKIINAKKDDMNFLKSNNITTINLNCRSTKAESFFYNHHDKLDNFLKDFIGKELIEYKNFFKFIEMGGRINLNIYSQFDSRNNATLNSALTHKRYMHCENGVFTIEKDLDIFKPKAKRKNLEKVISSLRANNSSRSYTFLDTSKFDIEKQIMMIGFGSDQIPFIAMDFPDDPPKSLNLNKYLS